MLSRPCGRKSRKNGARGFRGESGIPETLHSSWVGYAGGRLLQRNDASIDCEACLSEPDIHLRKRGSAGQGRNGPPVFSTNTKPVRMTGRASCGDSS